MLLRRQCGAKRGIAGTDNDHVGRLVCHLPSSVCVIRNIADQHLRYYKGLYKKWNIIDHWFFRSVGRGVFTVLIVIDLVYRKWESIYRSGLANVQYAADIVRYRSL